ncbi:MAG: protease modulator HflK, partial [Ottowia sp.]|nr:protease modulator HflK [Ottowia sp.]
MRISLTVMRAATVLSHFFFTRLRALFSLGDPLWGRGARDKEKDAENRSRSERPQGPPDLDEVWRDFNNKLNGLFGRKQGGGRGPVSPEGRFAGMGMGFIALVVVSVWLASGLFIVQEGQVGVVLQFGKFKYTTGSGINWRLPWPIQSHEVVNVSAVRSVEIGRPTLIRSANLKDSSMLTEDENIIDVKFGVQYRLKDAAEYLFNNRDAESSVVQAAEAAIRETVGRNKMDFVLYEG